MKAYRISALLLKYYYITRNRLDRLFDLFYWPVIDLFVWGFTSLYLKSVGSYNLLNMFLGGVLLWAFVWRCAQDIAVYVLEDFWGRNLYNLFSTPLRTDELVVSTLLFGLIRSLVSFVFMAVLAFIIYQFNIFSIGILYVPFFIFLLVLFGWGLGLFVTSLIFRYGSRIQVFAWSIAWFVQPISCVFYPLSALPSWAYPFAVVLPTTHIFEGLRAVLSSQPVHTWSLVYACVASLIFLLITTAYLYSSIAKARSEGLFTRYE